ncbi:MAG: class I SAM-dependent methyltransferase [Anaerolineae bacterium]
MSVNGQALTNPDFWDNYWAKIRLPEQVETNIQWQLALANKFRQYLPNQGSLKLFEVGGAPGRWLVWFNREMGYQVSTCDSSPRGVELTLENLRMANIEGEVYQTDFLTGSLPEHTFDVVVSIGFIEHFSDPKPIIARHLDLLKPGGLLALEVPNMAGLLNLKLLRLAGMQNFLSVHNLWVMNSTYFQTIAQEFNLKPKFLGYIGGFDPVIVTGSYPYRIRHIWRTGHFIVPGLVLVERLLFRMAPSFFAKFNRPWCSSMLLGIFQTPYR